MSKQFLAILAAIVIVFAGIVIFSGKKDNGNGAKSSSTTLTQHFTGNEKASVTLTEYGDYQCPFCEQYEPTVEQVVETNKDKIRFQFRNFPLVNLHQNAFAAARAAEAAGLQGKFWEMHTLLYQVSNWQVWTQASSPNTYFNQYAQQLGLDVTKFKADFASDKVNNLINADIAEGNKLGITGTPTFFLDGKQVQISNSVDSFQKVIDAELAKKAPKTSASTPSQQTQTAPATTNPY
jgi:protein-disulfide isomerase